jgi:hypothetical protein
VALLTTAVLIGGAVARGEVPAKTPPEMRILASRVGTWVVESVIKPGKAMPQGRKTKWTAIAKWVPGGRCQQTDHHTRPDGPNVIFLLTYDAKKKMYMAWRFSDRGGWVQSEGTWDKDKARLVRKWQTPDGTRFRVHEYLVDKDTIRLETEVRNKEGEVVLAGTGPLKRKK